MIRMYSVYAYGIISSSHALDLAIFTILTTSVSILIHHKEHDRIYKSIHGMNVPLNINIHDVIREIYGIFIPNVLISLNPWCET